MYVCLVAFVGAHLWKIGRDEGRQIRKRIDLLLQVTTPTAGLRRIRVLVSPDRTPHRWNLHRRTHGISTGTVAQKDRSKPATKVLGLSVIGGGEEERRWCEKREERDLPGDLLLFCSIVSDLRSLRSHVYVDGRGPHANAGCALGDVEVSTLTWTAWDVTTF